MTLIGLSMVESFSQLLSKIELVGAVCTFVLVSCFTHPSFVACAAFVGARLDDERTLPQYLEGHGFHFEI